jgi:hypothetical protein
MKQTSLNRVYSTLRMRRRYEVWFVRLGLADGSGAWWFRYLLMNLGRSEAGGCPDHPGGANGMPVQVWAHWFPRGAEPGGLVMGMWKKDLSLSARGVSPFHLKIGDEFSGGEITEDSCRGCLAGPQRKITWDLRYRSTFGTTLSDKGWIGFSRSPHSDAVFSGEITYNGQTWRGDLLGYGVQGHNCGFRHRHYWTWTHCIALPAYGGPLTSFEALEYEMPLGLRFRKAVLWHRGKQYVFRELKATQRDRREMQWAFRCENRREGTSVVAVIDGGGPSTHRLPYAKTDCSGSFEVANNSLARATLEFSRPGHPLEQIHTDGGAVLEMVGE